MGLLIFYISICLAFRIREGHTHLRANMSLVSPNTQKIADSNYPHLLLNVTAANLKQRNMKPKCMARRKKLKRS